MNNKEWKEPASFGDADFRENGIHADELHEECGVFWNV